MVTFLYKESVINVLFVSSTEAEKARIRRYRMSIELIFRPTCVTSTFVFEYAQDFERAVGLYETPPRGLHADTIHVQRAQVKITVIPQIVRILSGVETS